MVDGVALLRPLLGIRRATLRDYLSELSQEFAEDLTNDDPRYTRNRLRAELIPQLAADYNPRVVESLLRLGTLAGEAQASVQQWAAELAAICVTRMSDDQLQILAAPLVSRPRHMVREVLMTAWRGMGWPLQSMGFEEWDQLAEMLLAPPLPSPAAAVARVFPGGVQAKKPGESLVLTRLA
jgi:tRNA(Ile)-lysidine synthase